MGSVAQCLESMFVYIKYIRSLHQQIIKEAVGGETRELRGK